MIFYNLYSRYILPLLKLEELNEEAIALAKLISDNFKSLAL